MRMIVVVAVSTHLCSCARDRSTSNIARSSSELSGGILSADESAAEEFDGFLDYGQPIDVAASDSHKPPQTVRITD